MTKLTSKEISFISKYLENDFNAAAAYREAFGVENPNSAKSSAYKLLRKPSVVEALNQSETCFRQLSRQFGLDRKSVIKRLKDIVYGDNPKLALNAIKITCDLAGEFREKHEVSILESSVEKPDYSKMSVEELRKLQDKIISSM